jgi:ectoine hydroxylase-related dioxygenase (phytanoyl-CoA dioxygenase family)
VDQLELVTPLKNPRMQCPYYYHQHGFMVKFRVISEARIAEANISTMKNRFLAAKNLIVFNSKDVDEIEPDDAERRQLVTKYYDSVSRGVFTKKQQSLLKFCERSVVKIVKELLPAVNKFKTIESVLHSRDESKERQKLHHDLPTELDDSSALALVAFEPNTTFIMLKGSHTGVGVVGEDSYPRVYGLGVGDILIFHPALVHAGDRYSVSNLRAHYYVIDETKDYKLNLTYPLLVDVAKRGSDLLSLQEARDKKLRARHDRKQSAKRKRQESMTLNRKFREY